MSADNVVAGYTEAVEVNNVRFPRISCSWSIEESTFEARDDVSGPFSKPRTDGYSCSADVSFQVADDLNPHIAPYEIMVLTPNTTIDLKIYPRGLAFDPIHIPQFKVKSFKDNSNAQQGPVGGSFSGQSYGEFTLPADTING